MKPRATITIATIAAILAADAQARIPRSSSAKRQFQKATPCPATNLPRGKCPGYIIDHIVPLACKGPDTTNNMQWQTVTEAKAKDRWERQGCETP